MSSWKTGYIPPNGGGGGTNYGSAGGTGAPLAAMNTYQQQSQQPQPSMSDGPRNKCDAIVFEAIAKAAEIVVGSRCWIDPGNVHIPSPQQHQPSFPSQSSSPHQHQPSSTTRGTGYGNNNSISTGSRFNLLVPEVQGVRSILQRWKRALHVPLRLDVYYQHPDSQRELLERWCLEYAPRMGAGGGTDFLSTDPIVQLRQVCKNIVIWLRTLYCWSHMLPAQALRKLTTNNGNPIGFSIYVVSEGQDDVSGLVSSQGFHSQGQPQSVHTPYGELGWKVFYAPKNFIQKLLPEVPAYAHHETAYASLQQQQQHYSSRATTRPIPMRQQHQEQYQPSHHDNGQNVVQSAPQHTGHNRLYRRANSDVNETAATQAARSYHNRHEMFMKAGKAKSGEIFYNDLEDDSVGRNYNNPTNGESDNNGRRISVRRTHEKKRYGNGGDENDDRPPTKNLSALSLALMMSDEQVRSIEGSSFNTNGSSNEYDLDADQPSSSSGNEDERPAVETDTAAAEKRRAALHSAPPQFAAGVAAAAGEYGYAYNSQIPPIHQTNRGDSTRTPITPNASNTTSSQYNLQQPYGTSVSSSYSSNQNRHRLGSSPSLRPSTPLGATPPGYLLSGTPIMGGMIGAMTPGGSVPGSLIPPRSAVTPPFVRPVGFMVDPPHQPLPPSASTQEHPADPNGTTHNKGQTSELDVALQQHQTSLDLLHSSPFQYPPGSYSFHNSSLQQQLSSPGDGTVLAPAAFMNEFYHRGAVPPEEHVFTSGFPAAGGSMASGHDLMYDDANDMPFAVDSSSMGSHAAIGSTSGTATPGLASMMNEASLVASMCTSAPRRLALFDSKTTQTGTGGDNSGAGNGGASGVENIDSVMESLVDQLADFHTFGASLTDSQSGALPPATASASS